MGMCLDEHNGVSIEVRRESFVISAGSFDWKDPNPELLISELLGLRDAVNEAVEYCIKQGMISADGTCLV